jgi:Zn-dependent protease with chaperone function
MRRVEGVWYPYRSSARFRAELFLQETSYRLAAEPNLEITGGAVDLKFSDRIGNIPRKICFPDGSIFETQKNDLIDVYLVGSREQRGISTIIHGLENQWRWVLLGLLVIVVFSIGVLKWGVPWAAEHIAYTLPIKTAQLISVGTLEALDRTLLEKSELSEKRKEQLLRRFEQLIPTKESDSLYKLHFRRMSDIPNAFALPSGDIVITDGLVYLAEDNEEIDSVLLHEMGHVVYRHGLQQIIQASIISFTLAMISGDATGMNQMLIAFPAFLMQQKYSRDHETEADQYALERMKTLEISPKKFAAILTKLISSVDEGGDSENEDVGHLTEYLSTHPATQERVVRAIRAAN